VKNAFFIVDVLIISANIGNMSLFHKPGHNNYI
jgi:hypothetical protein